MTDQTQILRNIREVLVDFFVVLSRLLFFWLPGDDAIKGRALMAFHPVLMTSFVFLFFIVPSRHPLRLIIALSSVIVVASQWLLGGCVITRAEQRMTGEKITFLDPFLSLAHIEVNRETRNAATLGMSTATCSILIWNLLVDTFFRN